MVVRSEERPLQTKWLLSVKLARHEAGLMPSGPGPALGQGTLYTSILQRANGKKSLWYNIPCPKAAAGSLIGVVVSYLERLRCDSVPPTKSKVQSPKLASDDGRQTMDDRYQIATSDFGLWTSDFGLWTSAKDT